jgi:phage terminase small subunit
LKTEKSLSKKHQAFIDEYLRIWNGTRAYMRVYPKCSYASARTLAGELLAKIDISEAITERMNEAHMSADEALALLADQARGDMAQLMDITSMGFNMDMEKAKDAGLTKLIKKVKQKTTTFIAKKESEEDREVTELEVELYDAQAAIDKILRVHGKYNDKVDVTSAGEKIEQQTIIYIPSNGRDKTD